MSCAPHGVSKSTVQEHVRLVAAAEEETSRTYPTYADSNVRVGIAIVAKGKVVVVVEIVDNVASGQVVTYAQKYVWCKPRSTFVQN